MIPTNWLPHRRRDDDELVGYLVPTGDRFVPVTVFGYPIGEADDESAARERLESCGLSYLAERWVLETENGPIAVQVVEAAPDRVRLKSVDYGDVTHAYGSDVVLAVPVDSRLRLVG